MENAPAAQEHERPEIIEMGGGTNPLIFLFGGVLLLGGGYMVYTKMHDAKLAADQSAQNDQAGTDQPTNLANQIYAENRATFTSDDKMVTLFNEIADYKATKDAYTKISLGNDLLADTEKHVHPATYQQLLNILGIKGGSKVATSAVVKAATAKAKPGAAVTAKWVVTKTDTRVRRTPFAGTKTSAYLHLSASNIIQTVPAKTTVGFIDVATMAKNGNKPFYDTKNDTYFLPVLVFDKDNLNKQYTVYVAASTIDEYDSIPPGAAMLHIKSGDYTSAKATTSGLGSIENNLL